jgi:hypothetical protein
VVVGGQAACFIRKGIQAMLKPLYDVILENYFTITGKKTVEDVTVRKIERLFIDCYHHFLIDPMDATQMDQLDDVIRQVG